MGKRQKNRAETRGFEQPLEIDDELERRRWAPAKEIRVVKAVEESVVVTSLSGLGKQTVERHRREVSISHSTGGDERSQGSDKLGNLKVGLVMGGTFIMTWAAVFRIASDEVLRNVPGLEGRPMIASTLVGTILAWAVRLAMRGRS